MATDQLPALPAPYGVVYTGDASGELLFSREKLSAVEALLRSSAPVYAYSQMVAYGDARAAHAIAADRARAVPVAWREAFEAAMRDAWECADPLHPPGQPGSYARGSWQGMQDGLATLRNHFELRLREAAHPPAPEQPTDLSIQAAAPGGVDERAAFEAWAAADGFNIHRDESDKYRNYHRATTRFAWVAWQARASLSTPASGEGWMPMSKSDLVDDLVAISAFVCDGDDRAAQALLGELIRRINPAPTSPTEPAAEGGAA